MTDMTVNEGISTQLELLEWLERVINTLEEMLEPVMHPVPSDTMIGGPEDDSPLVCSTVLMLNGNNERIRRTRARLLTLTERLALSPQTESPDKGAVLTTTNAV